MNLDGKIKADKIIKYKIRLILGLYNTFTASTLRSYLLDWLFFHKILDSELTTFEMEMEENKVNRTDNHGMLRLSEAPTGSV
jgi:hypothetical protein